MNSKAIKGSLLVALGASSYGMLGTFVKIAYADGFSTAEVTISQFSLGFLGLLLLTLFRNGRSVPAVKASGIKGIFKLIFAGSSLGLTSVFYYLAVQSISVSIAIVLLMQTVWMAVIVEMVLHKKAPGLLKVCSVFLILTGTLFATNLLETSGSIHWSGCGWGIMAAVTYTATMYTSNHLELQFPPLKRSLYLILGGLIIICFIFHSALTRDFSFGIFSSWGLLISLFGTILPPLLFTRGMPLAGMGLGAIIASIEIPVAILSANVL